MTFTTTTRVGLLLLLSVLTCQVFAQEPANINFQLRSYLENVKSQDQLTHLIVNGQTNEIKAFAEQHKGIYKYETQGFAAIAIPVRYIEELSRQSYVNYIDFSLEKGRTMNDMMRINNNVDSIHAGFAPLNIPYTGKGVIIGFIDTGLEILHPDFWTDTITKNTRILTVWDQNVTTPGRIPGDYGYGTLWDSTDINAGICTHVDTSAHGTTVAGSACANGLAGWDFAGVATEADIIVVESDFESPNWMATIADAVDYMYKVADSVGKPCVINASVGSYLGPHDGLDPVALFIDSLVNVKRGRALVGSAGNSGTIPYHLETNVAADTSFTWFEERNANSSSLFPNDAVYFEVWSDVADFDNVSYAVSADKVSGGYDRRGTTNWYNIAAHVGTTVSDTIWNNGNILGIVEYHAELQNGRYYLEVYMEEPDSSNYNFGFLTTGVGKFDVWSDDWLGISHMVNSGLPSVAQFPPIANYVLPDANSTVVDSWNCSSTPISVANYINRTSYVDYNQNTQNGPGTVGELHFSSSAGPTRDGRTKPDIGSTGNIALSAGSLPALNFAIANTPFKVAEGGWHIRNGGTSMAAPCVSGLIACYLEKCPTANMAEIKEAVLMTATVDSFTGATPNNLWGEGKLNAFQAMLYDLYTPTLTIAGDTVFCQGDSVELIAPAGHINYLWSTGDTTQSIWISASDTVLVEVWDSASCHGVSRWHYTVMNPTPSNPIITSDVDTVFSSPAFSYQWWLDDNPLSGSDDQQHTATAAGYYFVQITDSAGCSAFSDSIYISPTAVEDYNTSNFSVYPNPSTGQLFLSFGNVEMSDAKIEVINLLGEVIYNQNIDQIGSGAVIPVQLNSVSNGVYFVKVTHPKLQIQRKIVLSK